MFFYLDYFELEIVFCYYIVWNEMQQNNNNLIRKFVKKEIREKKPTANYARLFGNQTSKFGALCVALFTTLCLFPWSFEYLNGIESKAKNLDIIFGTTK